MTANVFKKKKVVFLLTLLFCGFLFFVVNGQKPGFHFENITSKQGLADVNISAVIQDKQGFIWIGSEDGLTRYDGYNCVVYRHKNNDPYSLSDNEIYALCVDGDGVLWAGTPNGLNRYDNQTDRFENFFHSTTDTNSLAGNNVFTLAKDNDGNLWTGTYGGGLDKVEKVKNKAGRNDTRYIFKHYRHIDGDSTSISSNQVLSLCFDKNNRAWAGTSNALNVLDKNTGKFSHFYHKPEDNNSISRNDVYEIFAARNGSMWLCGKGMLDKIIFPLPTAGGSMSVTHYLPKLAGKTNLNEWAISDFVIDNDNNAWMATNDQGLIKFRIGPDGEVDSYDQFIAKGGSSLNLVNSIIAKFYLDRSGILWIGTAKGVSKYIPSKNRFNEINLPENAFRPDQHTITSLLSDNRNRLWLGYDTDTVTVINKDGSSSVSIKLRPHLSSASGFDQVNVMYQSKAGDTYIGTLVQGLFIIPGSLKNIYDKKNWIHINVDKFPALPNKNIYAITEDTAGMIWIGTYTGLCMYNPNNQQLKQVYASSKGEILSGYIIRALCADQHNTIWCGTDDGLRILKNGAVIKTFKNTENDLSSLSNNRITATLKDHKNQMWIGTKEGLNLYDEKQDNFTRFTSQNGLPNDGIKSVLEDKKGNLWIGTNNGLFKSNTAEKKFYQYSIEDGLQSDKFESNAVTGDASGILYFGTNNGLVSFKPENIIPNKYIPPVVITNVRVLNNPLFSLGDTGLVNTYRRENKLVLHYNQNFFSFEFAALNYINSAANQYSYKLEGIDRQWNNSGTQRFAGYTNIGPGEYTFLVKASNNDGVWNPVPATIEVVILPPWWRTWWFYGLCFLAGCATAYLIYDIRLRQMLKLYKLRSSIAKDLHDDVGSALSSIALLSRIAQEGKTNTRLKPEEFFVRIGDTSKRMIDLMDDIVWSVNPDNDRFSNMLVRMREFAVEMLEAKNISFVFKIAEEIDELRIPMQMRKDYFLIFKEAVNNLAKYSSCNNAVINIERNGQNIITTIADDGIGFDPQLIHSGNGVKNMLSRAKTLKGKLQIKTEEGKGTSVILIIPVT